MRIGIIGSGHIGATLAALWARAGHDVRLGARDPASIADKAAALGIIADTRAATAKFAEALFTASPYAAWPDLATAIAPFCAGKLVLDAANPFARDGAFAKAAIDANQGSGVPVARLLPGAFYVRAFNSIRAATLRDEAHRTPPRLAIPLVGDDPASLDLAAALVSDAGFDPLIVGPLVHATTFDPGAPAYDNPTTSEELERLLGLIPPG